MNDGDTHDRDKPILVVEDDLATQLLFKALLTRYGHTVEVAVNGADAIERTRAGDYSAIILDLMMPGTSGVDVIAALREAGCTTPVIVCTAAGPAATAKLDRTIVKAVMRKPFEIDELTATVAAVIAATPEPAPAPSRILVIDDDYSARYVIRTLFDDSEVSEAETGEGAVELIRNTRPDVVFLDLNLPGVAGEEVLRHLHDAVETRDLPVVIVTSRQLDLAARADLLRHASAVIDKGDLSREKVREVMEGIKGIKGK